MKKIWAIVATIIVLAVGGFFLFKQKPEVTLQSKEETTEKKDLTSKEKSVSENSVQRAPGKMWEGKWTRVSSRDTGILTISNEQEGSFDFNLNVTSGANVGYLEGTASRSADVGGYNGENKCQLSFTVEKESIFIAQSPECSVAGGIGTTFDGEYQLSEAKTAAERKEQTSTSSTLAKLKIVNALHDKVIQKLLGDDYHLLVESMQILRTERDQDHLGTNATFGAVRGLFTIMEGAVMVDPKGYVYVAFISDSQMVKFYTTNPAFKNKLPNTFNLWREKFSEYPVEFHYHSGRGL
ncbi:hypothetical protein [Neobacillus cucumis]|uniref:Uncharacterized protein n=1 Tax=Neobacillus cucumis TaxID=1740721 RepID=A0A2N5H9X8_9BACI|nr:hypothetical protein [Neobacillus cucumis]PLS02327.1 hypothetical protein CVD27_20315 [Neobacillus cucumis]